MTPPTISSISPFFIGIVRLISKEVMRVVVKTTLSSLLIILFVHSSIVRAQQSQSQPSTIGQRPAATKPDDKPTVNSPGEYVDNPDAKLPVYQVHRLADKILSLRNVRAKALEIARLASLLWKHDEPYARFLFEKALDLTSPNRTDGEAGTLSALHRRVIALIARSDAEWAKRLIDSAIKRETEDQNSRTASYTNIRTALGLVEEDAPVAVQFAERSLKGGVDPAFLDFVLSLRQKDEPEANRLFLQALNYLSHRPAVNIKEFHELGIYLFTAPNALYPDVRVMTLVGDILVPNITLDRPGVPAALVRAYLATAADVLWRLTSDAEQRKYSYALCYMLLPKSRNVAPDLTGRFDAVMAALIPEVPAGLTKESAFRYLNASPTSIDEQLSKAENREDQEGRDMAYLEITLQTWRQGDFKTARIAQGRISDLEASQRLAAIIDFGAGAWAIKHNAMDVSKAEAMANRLPQGIERSVLFQAIAKIRAKPANQYFAEETLDKALKAARAISDGRRPFLLLTAAAQFANLKSPAVHIALAEAVRDFNSFEESALAGLDWAQVVQIGPMKARFPLDVVNLDFNFREAFHAVASADPETAMARADELQNESLRAQSLVEVARAFVETIPAKKTKQKRRAGSRL